MAPKFPNPDPPTDKVRDRLDQFIQVAGRAVYPPLAVAPSPTTAGQVWWDISDTIKIRNEANAAWDDLLAVMGGQVSGGYVQYDTAQTLTSGEKTQALSNIGAQPVGSYVQFSAQTLTDPQKIQAANNTSTLSAAGSQTFTTAEQAQLRSNAAAAWVLISARVNTGQGQGSYSLPAGGQWRFWGFIRSQDGAITSDVKGGIAAGGTVVATTAGTDWYVIWADRIS